MRIHPQLTQIPSLITASEKLKRFIKEYETLHDGDLSRIGLQPKLDGAGIWTEGWGKAMVRNGQFMTEEDYPTLKSVLPYQTIHTEAEADEALNKKIEEITRGVRRRLKIPVTQHQFDALVSHAYNCGFSETLYERINNKASEEKIKEWITKHYIKSRGVVMRGLKLRRFDEWQIWAGINYDREYKLSA